MAMTRRQFAQTTLALGSTLASRTVLSAGINSEGANKSDKGPGGWQVVPAALSEFEWHKVAVRPRLSPGLTNWCMIDQNPQSKEVVISFAEITDPTGKMVHDPPRYDFSGLRILQRFLVSKDRGETWQRLADHPVVYAPNSWHLNGTWDRIKFRSDGTLLAFRSEHTEHGRRPMVYSSHSTDMARTWAPWIPVTNNSKRGMFSGYPCQIVDKRWVVFYEFYDLRLPTFKDRIRRIPPVWMTRPTASQRFGCAISLDNGMTWKDRPDLEFGLENKVNAGDLFEPAAARLKNGNILVVLRRHRFPSFGGQGLPWWQWVLEPTAEGFKILSSMECPADIPLSATGHPEVTYTHDGILLGVRSDGLWASVNNGNFWEKISDQYLGYYPQGVELDDGSLLVVGHLGGDNYWPPERDQEVRLTKFRLDRSPIIRNLDLSAPVAYTLEDQEQRNVRVRARIGTDGTTGLLARAREVNGKLSGYVFFCTANEPAWLLARLKDGKLDTIATSKLPGMSLTGTRPHLELAVVGNVLRAFVNTYPVASGTDSTFPEGHAGLIAQGGRARVESFEVLAASSLADIGGQQVKLVRDLGAMHYTTASDNWTAF